MSRIATGIFAALSLAAAGAFAGTPSVSLVTPVSPGRGQPAVCPSGTRLLPNCRSVQQCMQLMHSQQVCQQAQAVSGGRRRAVAPPKKPGCPVMPPGSKVSPKC